MRVFARGTACRLLHLRRCCAEKATCAVESPRAGRDYCSVPFFYNPRFDSVVEPLDLPDHILPPLTGDPRFDPANPIFAEYGYNALKGRLRSHCNVATRFYSDVDDIPQLQPR